MAEPETDDSQRSSKTATMGLGAAAATLLTAALWGGTPVSVSFSQDQYPPVFTAGVRFAQAAVFMLFWRRWEGCDLRLGPGRRSSAWILATLLFAQISLFHLAIKWSSTSHATVLINTFVFWVAAIEHFVTRTARLSATQGLGLALAGIGGVTILLTQSGAAPRSLAGGDAVSMAGDLCMAGSALLLAIKVIYTKHALRSMPSGTLIFWHDVFGVTMFFGWSFLFEKPQLTVPSWPAALGLLYQGVLVAGFCFALQAWLLRRYSAAQVSIYSVSTPLFGLLFAHLFRGDALSPWLLFSGLCVVGGILLVNRRPSPKPQTSENAPATPRAETASS